MTDTTGYIICTSPRSGSTLLCRMLAATGLAGDPESLFIRTTLADWADQMQVAQGGTDLETIARVLAAARRIGRGTTETFGLRQQRPSFPFLCEMLALAHPEEPSDLTRFTRAFGPLKFVHLTRADKVAQAVSYLRAQQSGLFHKNADGTVYESKTPSHAPGYDPVTIERFAQEAARYDEEWVAWFDRQGIAPLTVTYDNLSVQPQEELARVLEFLGLDAAAAHSVKPPMMKLADGTSAEWIARFRADRQVAR